MKKYFINLFFPNLYQGTNDNKITFTLNDPITNLNYNWHSEISTVQWPDVRLVDGDLPSEGRLQVNYKGKWHSICTNSKNWTSFDIAVVCRQINFSGGVWYNWFNKYNDSLQFLYEQPNCNGNEKSIQECPNWGSRKIGSGICDYHTDIGIRCSQTLNPDPKYWKGLFFHNAETYTIKILNNKWEKSISNSILENVVINYAGKLYCLLY